jgi:Phage tail assembly chaperone protein, TAC
MFAEGAARLAGFAAVLLGWRPSEFWAATPAELSTSLAPLIPAQGDSADANMIARLKEQFPDG